MKFGSNQLKRKIIGVVLCAAILLAGCAPTVPLQRGQIDSFDKNLNISEIEKTLGKATVVAQTEVPVNDKLYLARHYRLLTGSRQEMTMVCTPVCIPIPIIVPVTSDYVVIQQLPSRKLHAWGTLEELSKDSDPEISSNMPAVKSEFQEAKRKK